jgi:hypothetical protein
MPLATLLVTPLVEPVQPAAQLAAQHPAKFVSDRNSILINYDGDAVFLLCLNTHHRVRARHRVPSRAISTRLIHT